MSFPGQCNQPALLSGQYALMPRNDGTKEEDDDQLACLLDQRTELGHRDRLQEYGIMPNGSASLVGSFPKPKSTGTTRTGYPHEKKPYPMMSSTKPGSVVTHGGGTRQEDPPEPGMLGALIWGVGAIMTLIVVIILCRYLNKQNNKERQDKQTIEESLKYVDLQNDVYFQRIADIIKQESFRDSHEESIGHLGRNIASNPESTHNTQHQQQQQQQQLSSKPVDTVCDALPSELVGHIEGVQMDKEVEIEEIIKTHSDIREGGEWKPSDCVPRHRLAIVVPYRDRWSHLKVLLHYLLPVIKRQQIHFRVFVVEQHGNQTFNKGRIMNAAFREAMKMFNFQCVIFHDVDLVPEDDRNMYTCAEFPKHMSTAIDKFSYRLPYQGLVGGVLSFRAEHFQTVNGYSNMYWGWGGEDDDMTVRILHRGLRIFRPPSNVARYKMVKHGSRQLSELRLKLLRTAARRSRVEGLNNVPYTLKFAHNEKLFTHFMVDVGNP